MNPVVSSMRIARPSSDLAATAAFYEVGCGFSRRGGFSDHEGFDGIFLEIPGQCWHLELTTHRSGHPTPQSTEEDLLVLYVSEGERDRLAARLRGCGFVSRAHPNPYWDRVGAVCFSDPDGYVLLLCPEL